MSSPNMDEYDPGRRLTVKYIPSTAHQRNDTEPPSGEIAIEIEIVRAFQPFTMSVVCLARLVPSLSSPSILGELPSTFIIKLFDRRYVTNTRKNYDGARPWSSSKEEAYQRFLLEDPRTLPEDRHDIFQLGKDKDDGAIEAHIEDTCRECEQSELEVYREMADIQGTLVPKLYGTIRYPIQLPSPLEHGYTAQGMLLEFIPSTTLKQFLNDAMRQIPPPYDLISAVCGQTAQLMDRLDDFKVLNRDARIWNILVAPIAKTPSNPLDLSSPTSHRCVAIDFGCTRLRFDDETDEQWRRAKQSLDEHGAVGAVAGNLIRRRAEGREDIDHLRLWRHTPSVRWYRELSEEELEAWNDDDRWGLYDN